MLLCFLSHAVCPPKRQSMISFYLFIYLFIQEDQTKVCHPRQRLIEQHVLVSLVTDTGVTHMNHDQSADFLSQMAAVFLKDKSHGVPTLQLLTSAKVNLKSLITPLTDV